MPTYVEWNALRNTDDFDWEWDTVNMGYLVTSKVSGYVGNSIFLPAAGFRRSTDHSFPGGIGYYWSSSIYPASSRDAYESVFTASQVPEGELHSNRYYGFTVRAVSN